MTWFILISLLTIGLILVVAEVLFVPGTTLVGILGAIVTVVGVYYAFISLDINVAYGVAAATLTANLGMLIYGLRSGVWKKFALTNSIQSRAFDNRLEGLYVQMEGVATSDIKPIGKAEFADKIYEVKSDAGFIRVGTKVWISKLENNTIIVKV
ncbi:NfeD family protein [Mongoliitalea daihaiensis]|uniref:NfeD family protein n=1 Tax=Mongoliitalea daihaiensis TaxID=2782006 RepID=UPI001F3164A4|nr:NfeD family protein [Mongoliitalea daihaiensis]UJP63291.1 nodulation protein NfeD [Mongoliitalea daihaiensis]